MPDYRLALANLSSSGLGTEIIPDVFAVTGYPEGEVPIRWVKQLNTPGSIEFALPIDSTDVTEANFALGQREVHLYRDAGAGEVLVFAGRLWQASMENWNVRFAGAGWFSVFRRWELKVDFSELATDQLDIAWDLIAQMQSESGGNIGIVRGSATPSGVDRDVTYCVEARQNVGSAIEDLAGADNGFDFDAEPDKTWTTWSPRRGTDLSSSIVLDGAVNAADISYDKDAYTVNSEVAGVGNTEECTIPDILFATDATALSNYGLLQSNIQNGDVSADFLQHLLDEEIRITKTPLWQPKVTLQSEHPDAPDLLDYQLGDIVKVQASRGPSGGFGNFSRNARIIGIDVSVGEIGREMIALDLDGVT